MVKVLIIDRSEEHIETLSQAFAELCCEAYGIADGKIGLQKAKEIRPNLIIYDGTLDYDAPEFANEIVREFDPDCKNPDRPYMVLLTALPGPKQQALCEEMGFNEYLTKPTTLEALGSWIEKSTANQGKK